MKNLRYKNNILQFNLKEYGVYIATGDLSSKHITKNIEIFGGKKDDLLQIKDGEGFSIIDDDSGLLFTSKCDCCSEITQYYFEKNINYGKLSKDLKELLDMVLRGYYE